MTGWYNEVDGYAAQWLKNLMDAGHITAGTVDERPIETLAPDDVAGTWSHFFAGIAGWDLALRWAGWPADRPVWTGSCPCQPFSAAGKRRGADDPRHLWPAWRDLIAVRRPPVVFGEQVASRDGREWLAGVRADLEALGYEVGASDLCAAGVGAPHIRQRLWWVAYDQGHRLEGSWGQDTGRRRAGISPGGNGSWGGGLVGGVADATGERSGRQPESSRRQEADNGGRLGNPGSKGLQKRISNGSIQSEAVGPQALEAALSGVWAGADWLPCRDGLARRAQPCVFPLAHGVPGRVGRLRAYGNAIVPQVGAAFVRAFMDVTA